MVDSAEKNNITPRLWFQSWRNPREFFLEASNCMGQFEPDEILGLPEGQYLRDAYVAGLFARVYSDHAAYEVRLLDDNFPDAQLRDTNRILSLEITIADRKDRRMIDEHRFLRERRSRGEATAVPIDKEQDRANALEAIPRSCAAKVKKYLGTNPSSHCVPADLLLYVNFSTLWGPLLSDAEMVKITQPYRDNFQSIWLLCGARVFRPWPILLAYSAQSDPFRDNDMAAIR